MSENGSQLVQLGTDGPADGVEGGADERERLVCSLRESEAMLRAAQQLARVGSFVLCEGAVGRDGHWSDEARRIFSVAASSTPATVEGFVTEFVHPGDRPAVNEAMERALRFGQPCEIEYRTCPSRGEVRALVTVVEPTEQDGAIASVLCTALDVTERHATEAKLAEYRNELSHVARLATAGEMATVMAHEINQPLAAIAHTADACLRLNAFESIDRKEFIEHLTEIAGQARRASEIIRRIRNLVRKQPFTQRPLNLNVVVDDVLRLLSSLAMKQGVRLEFIKGCNLPFIFGDEIQLGQLAHNLIRNAFDAVMQNEACERLVKIVTSVSEDGYVVLDILDNGPGIPAPLQAKIFEPFYSTRRTGLGMGLPIARTIAETHQAELEIEVPALCGKGAQFRVRFYRTCRDGNSCPG
jgi:PAS domain S-box-containing protein